MSKKISAKTTRNLISATTIAPSQKAKMERIEGISTPTITCTAREDFVKNGVSVHAGEKFLLVQSKNFPGWYYVVAWAQAGIGDCSCSKPHTCEHRRVACTYTQTRHAVPVQKVLKGQEQQAAEEEMLAGMARTVERIKQKTLSRIVRTESQWEQEEIHAA
jgi:hypothetical protein